MDKKNWSQIGWEKRERKNKRTTPNTHTLDTDIEANNRNEKGEEEKKEKRSNGHKNVILQSWHILLFLQCSLGGCPNWHIFLALSSKIEQQQQQQKNRGHFLLEKGKEERRKRIRKGLMTLVSGSLNWVILSKRAHIFRGISRHCCCPVHPSDWQNRQLCWPQSFSFTQAGRQRQTVKKLLLRLPSSESHQFISSFFSSDCCCCWTDR